MSSIFIQAKVNVDLYHLILEYAFHKKDYFRHQGDFFYHKCVKILQDMNELKMEQKEETRLLNCLAHLSYRNKKVHRLLVKAGADDWDEVTFAKYDKLKLKFDKVMNEEDYTGVWETCLLHEIYYSHVKNAKYMVERGHSWYAGLKYSICTDGLGIFARVYKTHQYAGKKLYDRKSNLTLACYKGDFDKIKWAINLYKKNKYINLGYLCEAGHIEIIEYWLKT